MHIYALVNADQLTMQTAEMTENDAAQKNRYYENQDAAYRWMLIPEQSEQPQTGEKISLKTLLNALIFCMTCITIILCIMGLLLIIAAEFNGFNPNPWM